MKKMFFVAFVLLCAASVSYAESMTECEEKCAADYPDAKHQEECIIQKCSLDKMSAKEEDEPEATSLVFKPLR